MKQGTAEPAVTQDPPIPAAGLFPPAVSCSQPKLLEVETQCPAVFGKSRCILPDDGHEFCRVQSYPKVQRGKSGQSQGPASGGES